VLVPDTIGVKVPDVRKEESSPKIGSAATPSPSDTVICPAVPVMVLVAQLLAEVLQANPKVVRASIAARSFAKTKVGSPSVPSPFDRPIPAAGAVKVLPRKAPEELRAWNPVED
jgi:hypothetical protein